MAHVVRFQISEIKSIQINWPHVFAFLLTVAGLVIAFLQRQLSTASPITWTAAIAVLGGPIWALFLKSIMQTSVPTMLNSGYNDEDKTIPAPPPVMKFEFEEIRSYREMSTPVRTVPTLRLPFGSLAEKLAELWELAAWACILLCGLMASIVVPACTPADQAIEAKIEQTVLSDFEAGDGLPQIETDVAKLVAGQPGADVVIIVNDALGLLIDLGLIPANDVPKAKAMRTELQMSRVQVTP